MPRKGASKKQATVQQTRADDSWYRVLFESLADAVYIVTLTGRILEVNHEACRQLGYNRKELLTKSIKDIDADITEESIAAVVQQLNQTASLTFETCHICSDETLLNVELKARLIEYKGEEAVLGIARDVSQRKKTEDDLLQTNALLEGMLNGITDIIGIQKTDHTIIRYNQAGYATLGMSPSEVRGKKCYELIHRAFPCTECATDKALKSKKTETISKFIPEIGRYMECRSQPVLDKNGNIQLIIEQLHDITESKNMESMLLEMATFQKTLMDAIPIPVFCVDFSGRYLEINKAFEQFFGEKGHLLKGEKIEEKSPEDLLAICRNECADQSNTGGVQAVETRIRDAHGAFHDILFHRASLLSAQGELRGFVCALLDITTQKSIERQIQTLNQELERKVQKRTAELQAAVQKLGCLMEEHRHLEKMIQDFSEEERERIGRDIHDVLGQILLAIALKSQVLATKLTRKNLPEAEDATSILETAQEAAKQTRGISRLLFPLELEHQDLPAALHALSAHMEETFGVDCYCLLDENMPIFDIETATQLYRISQEAISNAIRHGHAKQIQVRLTAEKRMGQLIVTDNGSGFKDTTRMSIGRGLRIMQHRAHLVGGELTLDHSSRKGLTVCCKFPIDQDRTSNEAPDSRQEIP